MDSFHPPKPPDISSNSICLSPSSIDISLDRTLECSSPAAFITIPQNEFIKSSDSPKFSRKHKCKKRRKKVSSSNTSRSRSRSESVSSFISNNSIKTRPNDVSSKSSTQIPLGQNHINVTPPIVDQLPISQYSNIISTPIDTQSTFNSNDVSYRKYYNAKDAGPYVIHVQKVSSDDSNGVILRPVMLGKFLRDKSVNGIIPGSLKRIGRNRVKIMFDKMVDANSFIDNELLINNSYKVFIPSFCITKLGVVRITPDIDETEIVSNLIIPNSNCKVIKARRLKYKTVLNGSTTWLPSQTVVVTFEGQSLPDFVYLYYTSFKVEIYQYPTIQCYNCCRFGHTKNICRSKPRCFKCGQEHFSDSCDITEENASCLSCKGDHFATNKKCPEFIRQKNIKMSMAQNSISYMEACQLHPLVSKSYAEVTKNTYILPEISNKNETSINYVRNNNISYKKTVYIKPNCINLWKRVMM